ncbi:MAG: hypothetical protein GY776_19185 [Alteromonas sp.]|nr:hypothetical protein [Alteromonas sp.]
MKFLQIKGRCGESSFTAFEFTYHAAHEVIFGDQIWSDTHEVEIADYVSEEGLTFLISQVENKTAFKGALRRVGLLTD